MAKIAIEGREYTCSEKVKSEILWCDVRINSAISIAQMIEDKKDEIELIMFKKQSELQELINLLKNI